MLDIIYPRVATQSFNKILFNMCHLLHKVWYNLPRYTLNDTLFWYRCSTIATMRSPSNIWSTVRFTLFVVLKTISIYTGKSYKTLYTPFMFHTSNRKFIVKVLNWSNWNKIVFECIMGVNRTHWTTTALSHKQSVCYIECEQWCFIYWWAEWPIRNIRSSDTIYLVRYLLYAVSVQWISSWWRIIRNLLKRILDI